LDRERIGALLGELHRLIREFNPNSEKAVFALKEAVSGSQFKGEMFMLEESIMTFDFKKAEQELQKLAGVMHMPLEDQT